MPEAPLTGLVVCLPDALADHLVGVVEVLIQEGFRSFSVPVATEELGVMVSIFGARARIGASSVRSADDVRRAAELGAGFLLADLLDEDIVATAKETNLASYVPAMTPTEVQAALRLPVTGVTLAPADVVGHAMAGHLHSLGLIDRVVPFGGIGAYAAGQWLKAGSPAACVDTTLLGDAPSGGDLGKLRERCGSFRNAVPQPGKDVPVAGG